MLTLEEVHLHLADVPAEEFGSAHQTCAIGQLHRILTGRASQGFAYNVYPSDVAKAVAALNDNISPESRKALALMMPLPKTFPKLTPAHALKLIAWVSEQALGYYDGPDREVLERAVDLAKRAAAGEPYTEEEATALSMAVEQVHLYVATDQQDRVTHVILMMTHTLLSVVRAESWSTHVWWALWSSANVTSLVEADWREWLAEYLRIRTEA